MPNTPPEFKDQRRTLPGFENYLKHVEKLSEEIGWKTTINSVTLFISAVLLFAGINVFLFQVVCVQFDRTVVPNCYDASISFAIIFSVVFALQFAVVIYRLKKRLGKVYVDTKDALSKDLNNGAEYPSSKNHTARSNRAKSNGTI